MLSYQMSEVLTKENTKVLIYAEPTVYQKLSLKIRQQLSAIRILLYEQIENHLITDARLLKEEIKFNNPLKKKGKSVAEATVIAWEDQWEEEGKEAVLNSPKFKSVEEVLDWIEKYLTKKKAAHDKSFGVRVWNYILKKVNKKSNSIKKTNWEPLNLKF